MDSLIQDALDYLKEVAKTTPYVFATQEDVDYFSPRPLKPKPIVTSSPLSIPKKRVEAPVVPAKVELAPTPPPKPAVIVEKKQLDPDCFENANLKDAKAPGLNDSKLTNISNIDQLRIVQSRELSLSSKSHFQSSRGLNEMRLVIEKTFPEMALRETILDDAHAKKMSRLWEETYLSAQIVVIAFGEVGAGLEFLKNVVSAIDRLIAPAELIDGATLEKEQGWDLLLKSPSLKGILCSPWSSWKSTSLSKHYKQNGATQEQFLGPQKLLLLEPSLSYLKNPDRKRKLWQLINTQLLS